MLPRWEGQGVLSSLVLVLVPQTWGLSTAASSSSAESGNYTSPVTGYLHSMSSTAEKICLQFPIIKSQELCSFPFFFSAFVFAGSSEAAIQNTSTTSLVRLSLNCWGLSSSSLVWMSRTSRSGRWLVSLRPLLPLESLKFSSHVVVMQIISSSSFSRESRWH